MSRLRPAVSIALQKRGLSGSHFSLPAAFIEIVGSGRQPGNRASTEPLTIGVTEQSGSPGKEQGEEELKHADIVMIRPGSDPGAGAADGLGTPPSASPRLILRAALSVALPPLLLVVCGLRVSRETGRQEEQLQVLDRQLDRGRETGHQLEVLQGARGDIFRALPKPSEIWINADL